MRKYSIALAAAFTLCLTPVALAASPNTPQGNSGIDQYVEQVPDASGGKPSSDVGHGSRSGPSAIDPSILQQLRAQGRTGREAARVLASTAPAGPRRERGQGGTTAGGSSGPTAVLRALTDSGPVLPVLLVGSLVLGLAFLAGRRRRT